MGNYEKYGSFKNIARFWAVYHTIVDACLRYEKGNSMKLTDIVSKLTKKLAIPVLAAGMLCSAPESKGNMIGVCA